MREVAALEGVLGAGGGGASGAGRVRGGAEGGAAARACEQASGWRPAGACCRPRVIRSARRGSGSTGLWVTSTSQIIPRLSLLQRWSELLPEGAGNIPEE